MKRPAFAVCSQWIARLLFLIAAATVTLGLHWSAYPWPFELAVHWPEFWLGILFVALIQHARRRQKFWLLISGILFAIGLSSIWPYVWSTKVLPTAPVDSVGPIVHLGFANLWCERSPRAAFCDEMEGESHDLWALVEFTPEWQNLTDQRLSALPHRLRLPRTDPYGLAVFSRWPMEPLHAGPLGAAAYPFVLVRVLHPTQSFYLAVAHPRSPVAPAGWWGRNRYLYDVTTALSELPGPRVLIADMNAVPWSPVVGEVAKRSGLSEVRAHLGWYGTWPSYLPAFLRRPIDHVFLEATLRVRRFELMAPAGSDHLGLRVRFQLPL